ncbi:MAG TPA: YciI family protein [Verrucomicrobiae bacterium]|nr:YciI family protein [Verrucomicrobiae bacterium]
MNASETNNGYMLIFRGTDWSKALSLEEMQQVSEKWMAWFKGLMASGQAIDGNPLEKDGKIVSGKNGKIVSDGPFAESKEAIGGYLMLKVDSMDEAVAIAKQCPGLDYGLRVEVRPVAERCALLKKTSEAQLAATA